MAKAPLTALISVMMILAGPGLAEPPQKLVYGSDPRGQFIYPDVEALARTYELIDLQKAGLNKPKVAEKFKKLCREAKAHGIPIQIGMSRLQAHTGQWCLPWKVENKTTTANRTLIQESYLKSWDHWPYQTEPQFRRYLYFENDILVAIQE